ncbi:MAG: flagellar hook-associated protein FlgL, partial [Lachnospiraceae bacterium]|nr:flagellar hook-associated protein FlgL [Lachnospiraceae bacterium]
MAMRITTKMMQNTSIRNLNVNKQRQEKLTNQMSTGKKITRPSDDPVTAIRALKLNASLDKIDQYYERNAKDAQSWLDLTDKAIATVANIIGGDDGMRQLLVQAANSYNKDEDINAIVEQLVSLAEEVYSVGNADSAGRSLFTGYRTDLPLTFTEDKEELYKITEQLTNLDMDKMTYVGTGCLKELNEGNFNSKDQTTNDYLMNTTEYDVTTNDIYRFRLAYKNTDVVKEKMVQSVDANGIPVVDADGKPVMEVAKDPTTGQTLYEPNIKFEFGDFKGTNGTTVYSINPVYDDDGNLIPSNGIKFFESGTEEAYMAAVNDPDAVVYIASTGELLLGSNVKQSVSELEHDVEIRISYEKTNWQKNDLDPVHYFYTERKHETQDRWLKYNEYFLEDPTASGKQIIEYDIGNNQTIRVNTTADELFSHDIGRDIEELKRMVDDDSVLEANIKVIQDLIDSNNYEGDDLKQLELQKAALEKAKTYSKDKVLSRLNKLITVFDGYKEDVSTATTNCGSRGSRLELIQNRLSTQQTNYKELVSENEDADYAELTVQLGSIKM